VGADLIHQSGAADDTLRYLHLAPEAPLPEIGWFATHIVVIADVAVSPEWQWAVSKRMLQAGCLYMMAWGCNCSAWDDSVDYAYIDLFLPGETPDEKLVVTTWHDDEPLAEVFSYAKYAAQHDAVDTQRTLLLHIGPGGQGDALLRAFAEA